MNQFSFGVSLFAQHRGLIKSEQEEVITIFENPPNQVIPITMISMLLAKRMVFDVLSLLPPLSGFGDLWLKNGHFF